MVSVRANLNASNLEVGDQFSIQILVSYDKEVQVPGADFRPPKLSFADHMGTSSGVSTSINITNGKRSITRSKTLNLNYAALKEGVFTIPKFSLDIKGAPMVGPFKLKVHKSLPNRHQAQRGFGGGSSLLDEFFGGGFLGSRLGTTGPLDFFIEAELDRERVHKGEQFLITWRIYTNGSLSAFDTIKFPDLKGFWKEDVEFASHFNWEPVVREGQNYRRATLVSYTLTPYAAEPLVIDPFRVRATVRSGGFSVRSKVFKVESKPINLEVLPLKTPKPKSFYGGVGDFKVKLYSARGKRQAYLGETFDVQLQITGQAANAKFIKAPDLDLGDSFEIYSQKEDFEFFPKSLSSIKRFTFSILPKKEGVLKIPDLKISFYDPESENYYDRYLEFSTLKVVKNPNAVQMKDLNYVPKDTEKLDEKKLSPFKPSFLDSIGAYAFASWVVYLALFLILAVAVCVYRKESYYDFEQDYLKVKLEEKNKLIQELLNEKNYKKALTELINAYHIMVGGLSGKRYGTEEDFISAVEELPSGLRQRKAKFISLSEEMQKLRFGRDLNLSENRIELKACLKKYQELYSASRSYLS